MGHTLTHISNSGGGRGERPVLKSFLIFVVPGYAEKSLKKAPIENPRSFIAAGIVLIAVGSLLLYHLIAS